MCDFNYLFRNRIFKFTLVYFSKIHFRKWNSAYKISGIFFLLLPLN